MRDCIRQLLAASRTDRHTLSTFPCRRPSGKLTHGQDAPRRRVSHFSDDGLGESPGVSRAIDRHGFRNFPTVVWGNSWTLPMDSRKQTPPKRGLSWRKAEGGSPNRKGRFAYAAIRVFLQRLGMMADLCLRSGEKRPRRSEVHDETDRMVNLTRRSSAHWHPDGRCRASMVPGEQCQDTISVPPGPPKVGLRIRLAPRTRAFVGDALRIVTVTTPAASCSMLSTYRPPVASAYWSAGGQVPWAE